MTMVLSSNASAFLVNGKAYAYDAVSSIQCGASGGDGGPGGRGGDGVRGADGMNGKPGCPGGDGAAGGDGGKGGNGGRGGDGGDVSISCSEDDSFLLMLLDGIGVDDDPTSLVAPGQGGSGGPGGSGGTGGVAGKGGEMVYVAEYNQMPAGRDGTPGRPGARGRPGAHGEPGKAGRFLLQVGGTMYSRRYDLQLVSFRVDNSSGRGRTFIEPGEVGTCHGFVVKNAAARSPPTPTAKQRVELQIIAGAHTQPLSSGPRLFVGPGRPIAAGASEALDPSESLQFLARYPDLEELTDDFEPQVLTDRVRVRAVQLGRPDKEWAFQKRYVRFGAVERQISIRHPVQNSEGIDGLGELAQLERCIVRFAVENVSRRILGSSVPGGQAVRVRWHVRAPPGKEENLRYVELRDESGERTASSRSCLEVDLPSIPAAGTDVAQVWLGWRPGTPDLTEVTLHASLGIQPRSQDGWDTLVPQQARWEELAGKDGAPEGKELRFAEIQRRSMKFVCVPGFALPNGFESAAVAAVLVLPPGVPAAVSRFYMQLLRDADGFQLPSATWRLERHGHCNPSENDRLRTFVDKAKSILLVVLDFPYRVESEAGTDSWAATASLQLPGSVLTSGAPSGGGGSGPAPVPLGRSGSRGDAETASNEPKRQVSKGSYFSEVLWPLHLVTQAVMNNEFPADRTRLLVVAPPDAADQSKTRAGVAALNCPASFCCAGKLPNQERKLPSQGIFGCCRSRPEDAAVQLAKKHAAGARWAAELGQADPRAQGAVVVKAQGLASFQAPSTVPGPWPAAFYLEHGQYDEAELPNDVRLKSAMAAALPSQATAESFWARLTELRELAASGGAPPQPRGRSLAEAVTAATLAAVQQDLEQALQDEQWPPPGAGDGSQNEELRLLPSLAALLAAAPPRLPTLPSPAGGACQPLQLRRASRSAPLLLLPKESSTGQVTLDTATGFAVATEGRLRLSLELQTSLSWSRGQVMLHALLVVVTLGLWCIYLLLHPAWRDGQCLEAVMLPEGFQDSGAYMLAISVSRELLCGLLLLAQEAATAASTNASPMLRGRARKLQTALESAAEQLRRSCGGGLLPDGTWVPTASTAGSSSSSVDDFVQKRLTGLRQELRYLAHGSLQQLFSVTGWAEGQGSVQFSWPPRGRFAVLETSQWQAAVSAAAAATAERTRQQAEGGQRIRNHRLDLILRAEGATELVPCSLGCGRKVPRKHEAKHRLRECRLRKQGLEYALQLVRKPLTREMLTDENLLALEAACEGTVSEIALSEREREEVANLLAYIRMERDLSKVLEVPLMEVDIVALDALIEEARTERGGILLGADEQGLYIIEAENHMAAALTCQLKALVELPMPPPGSSGGLDKDRLFELSQVAREHDVDLWQAAWQRCKEAALSELEAATTKDFKLSLALRQCRQWDLQDHEVYKRRLAEMKSLRQIPRTWNVDDILTRGDNLLAKVAMERPEAIAAFQKLFTYSFNRKYSQDRRGRPVPRHLRVKQVIKVMNLKAWEEYVLRRELVTQRSPTTSWPNTVPVPKTASWLEVAAEGPERDFVASLEPLRKEVNEFYLFHGTNSAASERIAADNFQIAAAGTNVGSLFGRGIYTAESTSKADEYTWPDRRDQLHTMLVCRTTLGHLHYTAEKHPNTRQLEMDCGLGTGEEGKFTSVLGDREKCSGTYREFVVYDENLVYPSFVVKYERIYHEHM